MRKLIFGMNVTRKLFITRFGSSPRGATNRSSWFDLVVPGPRDCYKPDSALIVPFFTAACSRS
jgi:hypothetical protein